MNLEIKKVSALLCIALATANVGWSQKNKGPKPQDASAASVRHTSDSTDKKRDSAATIGGPVKIKKFSDVIKSNMHSQKGFFTVYTDSTKYYFAIPKSLFGRDILSINRIAKASVDMRNGANGMAGDVIGQFVYRFEMGPQNKILLRRISYSEYSADSTKPMYWAVQDNNVQPIAEVFPIQAYTSDSSSVVLDFTELLNSDNNIIYFGNKLLRDRAGIGSQQKEKSFVKFVHAYPKNVEMRALKTFTGGMNPAWSEYTMELNSSWVLLSEKPMQPRYYDPRVGYFVSAHKDFETNPQGVEVAVYANRWDLHPRKEDEAAYLAGKLVEPETPVIYYIDPNTPKKWVPYLMQGIEDWNKAFEQAGFKNAIQAKFPDLKDSTWSIEDASHAAIIYRPSIIANAMGPSTADPRSGQIVESHIFWYHNVMQLLHNWYMVQCGAVDPRAQKGEFDDSLMGQLIRFVSSHEVGHTLGLRHNFGSSSTVPVEKLRDKKWVEANGHTPSIMDYARFNYVAQPEDNISEAGLFPRIGDYDKWAIEWAYRWRPEFKDRPEKERAFLTKLVTDSLKKNHRLWFGSEISQDPRCLNEDLSDNAMVASTYGIKNLKRILPQIIKWNAKADIGDAPILEAYKTVFGQYSIYLYHVLRNVGGVYENVLMGSDTTPSKIVSPKEKQKAAVKYINDQFFVTPTWLANPAVIKRLGVNFPLEWNTLQKEVIGRLVSLSTMSKMIYQDYTVGKEKGYSLEEYLRDLTKYVFTDMKSGQQIDLIHRNLQKVYVARLLEQAFAPETPGLIYSDGYTYNAYLSDLQASARYQGQKIKSLVGNYLRTVPQGSDSYIHALNLIDKINEKFKNLK